MHFDRRLLALVGPVRMALALTVVAGAAAGMATVAQAHWLSRVISAVFLDDAARSELVRPLALLLGAILARAILAGLGELAAGRISLGVKADLRQRLVDHLFHLGPVAARRESSGELATVVVDGVEALDAYFARYLPQLFLTLLVPLTVVAFVAVEDPLSAVVMVLTAPMIPLFMVLIGHAAATLSRRQWRQMSRLAAFFLDLVQGLGELKLLGRAREQIEAIERRTESLREATMKVLRVAFLSGMSLELIASISTAVVAVQVGLRLLYGRLEFEQALLVLLLTPEFYQPLRALGSHFHAGMEGVAAADRIFLVLEQPGPERSGVSVLDPGLPPIELRAVHYSYPGVDGVDCAPRAAVRGIDLRIEPGSRVALVGPSGAGKSTLAALLMRFIEPDGGDILVGGVPLASVDAEQWRERIAWVPQHPHLVYGSVADNIRLGRPGASDNEMVAAACQAQAHDFIAGFADGYKTRVGERGLTLSGGQAQRIALARAFLRDTELLILDEPVASLDPDLERRLSAVTRALIAGRTAVIIAHRLATVAAADTIVVVDEGRVVQQGRHNELADQDGLYRRLLEAARGEA